MRFLKTVFLTISICALAHGERSNLLSNSPFIPSNSNKIYETPKAKSADSKDLELRFLIKGVCKIYGIYYFSIYDNDTGRAEWIQQGEIVNGFRVTAYDLDQFIIYYEWKGQTGSKAISGNVTRSHKSFTDVNSEEIREPYNTDLISKPDTKNKQGQSSHAGNLLNGIRQATRLQQLVRFEPTSHNNINSKLKNQMRFVSPTGFATDMSQQQSSQLAKNSNTNTDLSDIPSHLIGSYGSVRGRNSISNPTGKLPRFD